MAQNKYKLDQITEENPEVRHSFRSVNEITLRSAVSNWNRKHGTKYSVEKLRFDKVFSIKTKNK